MKTGLIAMAGVCAAVAVMLAAVRGVRLDELPIWIGCAVAVWAGLKPGPQSPPDPR